MADRARKLRQSGQLNEALALFKRFQQLAAAAGDPGAQSKALFSESGCYIRLFRYREALASANDAFRLADGKDNSIAGGSLVNKAAVYMQVGDYPAASDAITQAVQLLEQAGHPDYLASALLSAADIQIQLDQPDRAFRLFRKSIAVAQSAHRPDLEAIGQDHFGSALLTVGDTLGAEKALLAAQALLAQNENPENALIAKEDLAELYLAKKQYAKALQLTNEALRPTVAAHVVRCWPLQFKGRVLLALGDEENALLSFREAVTAADSWRENALYGDATRIHTVVSLSSIYQDYVDLAAHLALKRGNPALGRRALEVLVGSRAWSLQQEMMEAYGRNLMLPPLYYKLLSELQSTQAQVTLGSSSTGTDFKSAQATQSKLQHIQLQLEDLQNRLGLQGKIFSPGSENRSSQSSLSDIQTRLNGKQLLLSFSFSAKSALVWTVTKSQIHLYELPNSQDLFQTARAFASSVQSGTVTGNQSLHLSQVLFGQIPANVQKLPEWLIATDGPLLNGFPFAALSEANTPQHASLIASHTLRLVASEALIGSASARTAHGGFLGVADPIYNIADARRSAGLSQRTQQEHGPATISLGRLVGSEREVRSSAVSAGSSQIQILTGSRASIQAIQTAFEQRPELVHFAVHVVSPSAKPDGPGAGEAALALSLTSSDLPEFLTKESIASLRVPGSLVVLSGCASQQGQVLPSAGIIGLSRAWLIAGASAVLVTAWPTPDDSGPFFQSFYKHFRVASGNTGERAALALQNAQSEMRTGSGYQSKASYWSAYSLISKE